MSIQSEDIREAQIKISSKSNSPARKTLHRAALVAISLAGVFVFALRVRPATMDYIEYWSSGHLLVHLADPYSPSGVFALEKANGFRLSSPLIMPNPPWALFLVAPLGFETARTGLFFWTLTLGACILVSVHLLNPNSRDNPLALLFAPAIACIGAGQSSAFLLLGFSLFLYFHRSRPFLAGASLLLMAIKPHLFLVFWAVLLAECIHRRTFRLLAGGASALIAATAFSMSLDPHIWQHYLTMIREHHPAQGFLPTLSMFFRILIDARQFWLLFVPSAFAVLWGLWYYFTRRSTWDWRAHGMLLILVTVLVSPYAFFTDEIVLLPAIIFALNLPEKRKYSGWMLVFINVVALTIYMAAGGHIGIPVLVWTPFAWLAWFLYATGGIRQPSTAHPAGIGNSKMHRLTPHI